MSIDRYVERVREFNTAFGCGAHTSPSVVSADVALVRSHLNFEELAEYMEAVANHDLVGTMDALCDLTYVVLGAAVVAGVADDELCDLYESKGWPAKDLGTRLHYAEIRSVHTTAL